MIMLEDIDIYSIAWYIIMDVFRITYYRLKVNANNKIHVDQHKNVGMKKPRTYTLQAMVTLHLMLEQLADHMSHKTTILETREKVVSKCLPSSWPWKDFLSELNIVNAQLGLNKVLASRVSRIWNESFLKYSINNCTLLNVISVIS